MSETAIYGALARAAHNQRRWRKALAYAIFAGAAVGSVACGFFVGWAAVTIAMVAR